MYKRGSRENDRTMLNVGVLNMKRDQTLYPSSVGSPSNIYVKGDRTRLQEIVLCRSDASCV